MRTDLVQIGQIVEFRQGNGVHTGTVKSVGRNGNDEMGSEVVIGDIYPHIYNQPTVTMHGLDLIAAVGRGFPQVTNQRAYSQSEQRNLDERTRRLGDRDGRGYPTDGSRFADNDPRQGFQDGRTNDAARNFDGVDNRNTLNDAQLRDQELRNIPEPVVNR